VKGDFQRQVDVRTAAIAFGFDFDRVQDVRQLSAFELDVDDRTGDGHHASFSHIVPS